MRGKLRDKRPYAKHDSFKREEIEQRRPYKRDSRTQLWSDPQLEEDEFYDFVEDDLMEDENKAESDTRELNKK